MHYILLCYENNDTKIKFAFRRVIKETKEIKAIIKCLFKDWQAERRKCQKRRRTEDLEEPCAKKMKMIDDEIVLVNRPEAEKLPAQEPTPSFNPYK